MVSTILIDVYLLYNFFTRHKATSQRTRAPLTAGNRAGPHHRTSYLTDFPDDASDGSNKLLGYGIALIAILMLVHTFNTWPQN